MDIGDAYPSPYLKVTDLKGKTLKLKIKAVSLESVGDKNKPVLYFEGADKGLVLIKTNAVAIAEAYGSDTDGWIGKYIELYPTTVYFQGKNTPCLRVRPITSPSAKMQHTAATLPKTSMPSDDTPSNESGDIDDSIPF